MILAQILTVTWYTLYAVCPQSTLDHFCYGGRELNMPMERYPKLEYCEIGRLYYQSLYPHILFQCTTNYPYEVEFNG